MLPDRRRLKLAKVGVEGSNPFARSRLYPPYTRTWLTFPHGAIRFRRAPFLPMEANRKQFGGSRGVHLALFGEHSTFVITAAGSSCAADLNR